MHRREFLCGLGSTLGAVAFSDLLAREARAGQGLSPGPHHPAKAKAVIMLFMEGGPSHIDTFDPKPKLDELHMTPFVAKSEELSAARQGDRFFVKSPYRSRLVGDAGIPMCEHFVHLAQKEVANELCIYRGCFAESTNHPAALYHMNTGNRLGGDPGLGAWINYGLGSENENLPGYIVMQELAAPQGGSGNWTNGFLPPTYAGTQLRSQGSPILDLDYPAWKGTQHQRKTLDALAQLNEIHSATHPEHDALKARMENYELAFRMQSVVPEVLDVANESEYTRQMYGLDDPETAQFGRQCLMARRLVESGVRFIQIFSSGWDSHDYLERAHQKRIYSVDKPMAGLIKDLKARGMLDETLVIWTGEFGRTPDNTRRGGEQAIGRDHNADAMCMLFAGGGTKRGSVVGATDEIGAKAVEVAHPIRDVHVTLLHLLGLDDNKLTYIHGGRFKQLSQFGGQVISELLG